MLEVQGGKELPRDEMRMHVHTHVVHQGGEALGNPLLVPCAPPLPLVDSVVLSTAGLVFSHTSVSYNLHFINVSVSTQL